MHDTILIPTDGRPGVAGAIDHAIDLAELTGATLHVLYVLDQDVYSAYPGDEYVDEREGLEHALEQRGEDAIEEVSERASDAGVEVVGSIQHGVPHEAIVDYVEDNGIDHVVMGTRRRSDEYRQVLGSVTHRVAQLTDAPVTIVKS